MMETQHRVDRAAGLRRSGFTAGFPGSARKESRKETAEQARSAQRLLSAAILVLLAAAGCSRGIETEYGQRRGTAPRSVNGTAVLADMFAAAGHDVSSWSWLSPRLGDRADCIVWIPNDFAPPSRDVRRWLDDWLQTPADDSFAVWQDGTWSDDTWQDDEWPVEEYAEEETEFRSAEEMDDGWTAAPARQPTRTLIYIGRDFDAESNYWNEVKAGAPPEQAGLIAQAASEANSRFLADRSATPSDEDCRWFTVKGKYQPREVRTLAGPWAKGIDASKVEIELNGRIEPAEDAEVLLHSEGDVLVAREYVCDGQRIIVANGSFLLNLPLVNHEHRKLAAKLIDEIGPPGKTVVFLESSQGGPAIHDEDPSVEIPTGMEIFFQSPGGWILWHFVAVSVLFCLMRWPIFGLPREIDRECTSDFGKHVDALADLLERSGDRAYAARRLAHYRQITKEGEP